MWQQQKKIWVNNHPKISLFTIFTTELNYYQTQKEGEMINSTTNLISLQLIWPFKLDMLNMDSVQKIYINGPKKNTIC